MSAYGLLIELWKAHQFGVPVLGDLFKRERNDDRTLRSDSSQRVVAAGNDSFTMNCARLYNMTSTKFRTTNLLKVAKSEARVLVKSLPI